MQVEKTSALDIEAFLGTIVSGVFLFLTGTMSLISLKKMLKNKTPAAHDYSSNSVLAKLLKPIIKMIDRPYKMYFVVGIFMLLPLSFALGMIIVDSIDARLMSKVLSFNSKEQRFYHYNIIILSIVIAAAYIVALVELLGLLNTNVTTINLITDFINNNLSTI